MRNLRISVLKDLLQLGQLDINTAKAIAVVKSGYFDKLIVDCHDGAKHIFYTAQRMIQDEIVANGQFACDFDG